MLRCYSFLLLIIAFTASEAYSQDTARGLVVEEATGRPLNNVAIENVYTHDGTFNDSSGKFAIAVSRGQLVEFRKLGYKVARARIPEGQIPPYFKIIMQKGAIELAEVEVRDRHRGWPADSMRNREVYGRQLDMPRMSTLDAINHPFSALSKKNRQIWAFQKEYEWFESMRYVDYAFNEKLVTNLTGLTNDSLRRYMVAYRPSYELLRSLNEYDFFAYIKRTAALWRRNPRAAVRR